MANSAEKIVSTKVSTRHREYLANSQPQSVPYRGSYVVDNRSDEAIQSKNINKSGISEDTKAVFEQLSGHSFDDVRVHYNSDKPNKIGAYGYARGTNVYLAPGQNRHLHHELWHVAQQKAGRVKANLSFNKLPVNYDVNLEREADQMGDIAMKTIQRKSTKVQNKLNFLSPSPASVAATIQGRFYEQMPDGSFTWWRRPMIFAGGSNAWRPVLDPVNHIQIMHQGYGVWTPSYKRNLDRQRVKGIRGADGNTTGLRLGTEDLHGAPAPWPGSRSWPASMQHGNSAQNQRNAVIPVVPQSPDNTAWGHQLAMQWGGRARINNAASATNSALPGQPAQEEYQTIVEDALSRFCADHHVPLTEFRIKHTAYLYPGTHVAKYMRIKIYRENPPGNIIKVVDQNTPDDAQYLAGGRAQAGTARQIFQLQLEAQLLANLPLHAKRATNPTVVMSWNNPGTTGERP